MLLGFALGDVIETIARYEAAEIICDSRSLRFPRQENEQWRKITSNN
jgi:hypothetical protein